MAQENTGTGATHHFQIALTKVDVERRLVIGTAAAEVPDKSGEIMDYATARPQFEKWSQEFSDATGGLSKGNLRIMHGKDVGGRFDDIAYDDNNKTVQVVAKVVDDQAWQKVLDGCYTGFSIGGGYLKKWKDPDGLTRYTPIIREISLVDNPCMPGATFAELVKADGITEQLELKGVTRSFAEQWATRPRGFDEHWEARPRTFGELTKGLSDHVVPAALTIGALGAGAAILYHAHKANQEADARSHAAEEGFRRSAETFFQHKDNSRATDSEVNHHLLGALHAWQHHAAGNLDYDHAKRLADTHVAILTGTANRRLNEENELHAQHKDGLLTEKEHAERVSAAKARWAHEGAGPHVHLTHFTHFEEVSEKAATIGQLRKTLSSNPLAGTIGEDGLGADPTAASAQRRAARAAGGLPSKSAAGTSVRRKLGLDAAPPPVVPIEKLAKRSYGEWSDDKHPRGQGGKFASKGAAAADDEPASILDQTGHARVGALAGAGVGADLYDHADDIHDAVVFGRGEKGSRNRFAAFLRDPENKDIRQQGLLRTRKARLDAMGAHTLQDRVNGARQKVAQEQFDRNNRNGSSSMDGVQEAADSWTHKLLARADKKGSAAAVKQLKTGLSSDRATYDNIKASAHPTTLAGKIDRFTDKYRLGAGAAAGLVGGAATAYLGMKSAQRLKDEKAGREVGVGEHVIATAGDIARLGTDMLSGRSAGMFLSGAGTALAQTWRPTLKNPFRFDTGRLDLGHAMDNATHGGRIGAALGAGYALNTLVPEYAARLSGGSKKDKA